MRKNAFRQVYDNESFKSILKNKNKLPEFPFLVDIELTNHCNLKCVFCGQMVMSRKKGFIHEDIFKKVVDECGKYSAPIRLIRFGEPFLHSKIIDFCKYIKSKKLPLHITNNGLIVKESELEAIVDLEVDSIIFSFQGATKEEYEFMRDNNQYNKLKRNILRLVEIRGKREKPFIHISSTMTDDTEGEIKKFIDYWSSIVDSVDVGKTNFNMLTESQITELKNKGKLEDLKKKETIEKTYKPCAEVYQKLSVNWDGKVTCCCGDFDDLLLVGDLNNESLFDVWNKSDRLKAVRSLLDNMQHTSLTLCKGCYFSYEDF